MQDYSERNVNNSPEGSSIIENETLGNKKARELDKQSNDNSQTSSTCKLTQISNSLKKELDPKIFDAWIEPLNFSISSDSSNIQHREGDSNTSISAVQIEVISPSVFSKNHVLAYYKDKIESGIKSAFDNEQVVVEYRVSPNSSLPASKQSESLFGNEIGSIANKIVETRQNQQSAQDTNGGRSSSKSRSATKSEIKNSGTPKISRSLHQESNLNANYNFSNLVVGSCNQFAHAASMQVAQNIGKSYNPLFVYGGVGLGKTHLVSAIGNYCIRHRKKVLFVSSEVFINEMIHSIRNNRMDSFKGKFRSIDVLIIDDIQFLKNKDSTQEEFFHTFNELHNKQKQIIMTSDCLPQELTGIEERLKTRFASGLSVDLKAPDYETRAAILSKKSMALDLFVPDEVVEFLAENINTNVRELEGALNRISAMAAVNNEPISLAVAQKCSDIIKPKKQRGGSFEAIIEVVAENFNVAKHDILGKRRTKNIATARQVAMMITRRVLGTSYPEIGLFFGGRDHSTVIHAVKTVSDKMEADSNLKATIEEIEGMF